MSVPSSPSRTPRWPLSAQIIALMFGCLIVAQAVTLCLTLILPPAPEPQYGLHDIASAMRGELRSQKGARPLTRTVSTAPPSLQTPGWLASEGSSAELARMLGASRADVRLLFYTPLPFAGAAAPARPPEGVDLVPEPREAAAPIAPKAEPAAYDREGDALDAGPVIALTPVVYQAASSADEGGLRAVRRGFGGAGGFSQGALVQGGAVPGGFGQTGLAPGGFVAGVPMASGDVRFATPRALSSAGARTITIAPGGPGGFNRGQRPIALGQALGSVGGGVPTSRFDSRNGFGAGPSLRAADGSVSAMPQSRAAVWPDARPMTLRGIARDRAAAGADTASTGWPRTAAQVSGPSDTAAAPVTVVRSQPGQGPFVQRLQSAGPSAGSPAQAPTIAVAPASPARIFTAQRPMDWTVRLPGRIGGDASPPPADRIESPPTRTVQRPLPPPRTVETVTTTPMARRALVPLEVRPPAPPVAVAAAPLPELGRVATPAARVAAAPAEGFAPARPVARGLFGLAPAPMIEGDFVAAWREAPGRWIVVRPTPEAFPNSWQRRVLLWFALSLAVVAPLGYLFARSLTTPLTEFVNAAEVIGRDPSAAVLVKEGPAEVGRAGRAFNQMQRRIKRFIDDRAAVVSALSHDLRAPLVRMRFRAEKAPPDVRAGMLHEVAQMEDMITSVLAFMRDVSEAGPREPVDLRSVLECVIDDAALTGGEAVLESAEDVLVEVDAQGVRRALTNLVENALKYGESARARLYVEGEEAVVEIVDKGPGVPETELERVFQPFYRTQQARTSDKSGVGLGLVSARSMVRAHGGEVSLRNSGAGLIAQVRLPLPREAA